MPADETKKKHRLFPFHIIRKRSKGKSKSLADLSGRGEEDRRPTTRLPRQASLSTSSSLRTDDGTSEIELKNDLEESLDRTPEEKSCVYEESDEERQLSFDNMDDERAEDLMEENMNEDVQPTPQFPQGTSVSKGLIILGFNPQFYGNQS